MKIQVKISLSFFIAFLMVTLVQAKSSLDCLPIGKVYETEEKIYFEEAYLPLVKINNSFYLAEKNLIYLGMQLEETEDAFVLKESDQPCVESDDEEKQKVEQMAYSVEKPLYCQHARCYMARSEGQRYIPVWVFKGMWHLEKQDDQIILAGRYLTSYLSGIRLQEKGIENQEQYGMLLLCRHGFWEGKEIKFIEEKVFLEPSQIYTWQNAGRGIFAGTQIEEINGLRIPLADQTDFDIQKDFFEAYTRSERLAALEKVFPPFIIEASMNYNVGHLKQKQIVSLLRSEKHAYYWIKDENGKKMQVPFGSVRIIGERGARLPVVTPQEIEEFANLCEMESETDFLLWTDLYRQKTYVLQKKDGQWKHQHTFVCSTGKNINPTPAGFYKVQYAIPYFGVGKGFRCKYALVFFRDYMYHSILFDKTGQYIKSGQYELGSKASHGCIRLSEKDSNWLYKHIPVNTTVWIR